jgi:transcriptional regulator with XRE-family HTH domain
VIRRIPKAVREAPLATRIKWARTSAGLSHDRLVSLIGRSNRGHLIKIEKGEHVPRQDLRDAIADATGVPRSLFDAEDDEETDLDAALMSLLRRAIRAELARGVAA